MASMEEKHVAVREWLSCVFAGEEIPEYEITQGTVEQLWRLSRACRDKENKLETIVEDVEQKTQEYEAEMRRVAGVLEWVGVGASDLSEVAQKCVQSVAGTALALGTRDSSDSSLCLSLSEVQEREAALKVREGEVERERELREEDLRRAVVTQATQKQSLTEFSQKLASEAEAVHHQRKTAEFFAKKSNQYRKLISSMKAELQQAGYNDSLSHAALIQLSKEVDEVQLQLDPLKTQLASFQGLPPDLDLAKVKVEGARRQLVRLEVELSRCLDLVHTEN